MIFPLFLQQNRVKITFIFKNRIANICILSSINNRDNQGSSRVSIRVNKKEIRHYFWYSNTHHKYNKRQLDRRRDCFDSLSNEN